MACAHCHTNTSRLEPRGILCLSVREGLETTARTDLAIGEYPEIANGPMNLHQSGDRIVRDERSIRRSRRNTPSPCEVQDQRKTVDVDFSDESWHPMRSLVGIEI